MQPRQALVDYVVGIADAGIKKSDRIPRFTESEGLRNTAAGVASLPVPAVVGTAIKWAPGKKSRFFS